MLGLKPKGCLFDHSDLKYVRIETGLYEVLRKASTDTTTKPIRWEHIGNVSTSDDGWEMSPAGDLDWLPGFKTRALASDYLISWAA